jgi:hypothetical protein
MMMWANNTKAHHARRIHMQKIGIFTGAVVVGLCFLLVNQSLAQKGMRWKGQSGWGIGTQYSGMYDPKTVETINGEVISIDTFTPMKGMSSGVHLMVKTEKETLSVHLGPKWYIENQDVKIEPKNKVEIKGSRISYEGKPAVIAARIAKGDEILQLRDDNGYPLWSGWRRRSNY